MNTSAIQENCPDVNDLSHCAQYLIGPRPVKIFDNWKVYEIRKNLFLTAHPYLPVHHHHHGKRSVTLLGYILDPEHPKFTDAEILNNLLVKRKNLDALIAQTFGLGGRWLLIADDGNACRVIPDAAGLRQLFYTDLQHAPEFWCFSQPNLAGELLDYQMDPHAVEYIHQFMSNNDEHWWPGTCTAYREIKALIPNHYLSLEQGNVVRFWPDRSLPETSLEKAVEKIKHTFSAMMLCAANRFELAVGISSGLDSRLLLASCKAIRDKVVFYTKITDKRSETHPDIAIPCRLASKLGLDFDLIDQRGITVSGDFKKVFCEQVPFAHSIRIPGQQKNLQHYGRRKVAVTGNISEAGRCRIGYPEYRLKGKNKIPLTGRTAASLLNVGEHPFAIDAMDDWLSGLKQYFNHNAIDLLHWEQRYGRWFANNCAEFDIAWKDYFTPYNNRNMISDMLSVNERHRVPPDNKLYQCLIQALWPETLSEPVNPHKYKKKSRLMPRIKSYVKALIQ